MLRTLLLVLLIVAPARAAELDLDPRLQARLESLMAGRPGAVLVYRLGDGAVRAAVRPRVAFGQAHPPGSVAKIVTASALLESRVLPAGFAVNCTNHVTIAGRGYTCGYPGGHGKVDLKGALERSCSIFFYVAGQRLADPAWRRAAASFGLGSASAPYPGAAAGRAVLPTARRARTLALAGEGGTVLLSPWQAAVLIERVLEGRHGLLREALVGAVLRGTGKGAGDAGGKTGTAEIAPRRTLGWFAGWTPARAPRYVVVVFLESASGHDAALLAGRVIRVLK